MRNEKKSCCCCSEASAPETSAAEVSAPAAADCCAQAETEPAACCRGMLEKDAYCVDILVQVAATTSALNSFAKELLAQHIGTCVADDLRAGGEEKLDELLWLLPKLMK